MKKLLLLVFLLYISGCARYKIAIPVYEQMPTVFGLYELGGGYSYNKAYHNDYYYGCGIRFINAPEDTTYVDTLPVIVVDSICFEDDCLGGKTCYIPISINHRREKERGIIHRSEIKIRDDLEFYSKVLPLGYYLECGYYLPKDCQNYTISSIVYASLYERATQNLIAIDSAIIDIRFDTDVKWYRSLGYTGPLCGSDTLPILSVPDSDSTEL